MRRIQKWFMWLGCMAFGHGPVATVADVGDLRQGDSYTYRKRCCLCDSDLGPGLVLVGEDRP
jgi:hypothetical protein